MTATLFNIQRFSTEDGPGIRTTLFFQGCPLACPWCHNPEGMDAAPRIAWQAVHCVGCGDCEAACPRGGLRREDGRTVIDRAACDACGTCVDACPAGALERVGTAWEAPALVAEVLKDRPFFASSGGGVTLSGGEPLVQHRFLRTFLPRLRAEGVHVALDTSGYASETVLRPVLEEVDLVLLDLKLHDPEAHLRLAGVPLAVVLASVDRIAATGLPVWVRTPVIPGMTDGDDNVRGIAALLRERLPRVERWDLLAFSNLCGSKYAMLGLRFPLDGVPLLPRARLEALVELARGAGIGCARWSGPVA